MPYEVAGKAVFQLIFEGRLFGQQVMTVTTWQRTSSSPNADGKELLFRYLNEAVSGDLKEAYRNVLSANVGGIQLYGQWIFPTRYAYVIAPGAAFDGNIVGESAPPNVSQVITRRGELARRDNISNLHIPGVPLEELQTGLIEAAQLTLLQELATILSLPINDGEGDEAIPIAFHRAAPNLGAPLVEGYPQPESRVMRRRTVGLGS